MNPNDDIGSKSFAEKAAWKFMEEKKPNFILTTICPTLVFGPIVSKTCTLLITG
jgi:hypothetical protein